MRKTIKIRSKSPAPAATPAMMAFSLSVSPSSDECFDDEWDLCFPGERDECGEECGGGGEGEGYDESPSEESDGGGGGEYEAASLLLDEVVWVESAGGDEEESSSGGDDDDCGGVEEPEVGGGGDSSGEDDIFTALIFATIFLKTTNFNCTTPCQSPKK